MDLSTVQQHDPQFSALRTQLVSRRLVVFLLDATWRLVRPMFRTSLSLQRLPRIMFSNAAPSRYIIKRQPEPGCLSTLEATHELLVALDRSGLDAYTQPAQTARSVSTHAGLSDSAHGRERARSGSAGRSRVAGESATQGPRTVKRRRIFPVAALG